MAQKEATLLLKIKEMGSEALDRIVITLDDLKEVAHKVFEAISEIPKVIAELVMEGGKIKQINNLFETLSEKAGLSADVLRNKLVGAADGLANDTDIIQAANKALIQLQVGAEKLPQLFELARKTTKVFGGDLISNFEDINRAVASGQTRLLRTLGIVVDSDLAYKNMAKSLHITTEELSIAQKQQAIMNAVLEAGDKSFKGTESSVNDVGNAFKRFKVAIDNIHESFAVLANTTLGQLFVNALNKTASAVNFLKDELVSHLGKGAEQTEAQINLLNAELGRLQSRQKEIAKFPMLGNVGEADQLTKRIILVNDQIENLHKTQVEGEKAKNAKLLAEGENHTALTLEQVQNRELKKIELQNNFDALEDARIEEKYTLQAELKDAKEIEKASIQDQIDINQIDTELKKNDLLLKEAQSYEDKKRLLTQKSALQLQLDDAKFKKAVDDANVDHDKKTIQNRTDTLNTIATLQHSNNQALATIGKAAALTQIAIDTPVAISKALAAFPPPINFAAAAAVGAAMAAQTAQVLGVQLADGGIVRATPGGIQATIGEGGRDEAVIPLDKAGGFGSPTINIIVNGGMLGDPASAHEFAIAVDRQLYQLRKGNESLAFDSGLI